MATQSEPDEPARQRMLRFLADLKANRGGSSQDLQRRPDLDQKVREREFCGFSFANRGTPYELCLENSDTQTNEDTVVVLDGEQLTWSDALASIRTRPSSRR